MRRGKFPRGARDNPRARVKARRGIPRTDLIDRSMKQKEFIHKLNNT